MPSSQAPRPLRPRARRRAEAPSKGGAAETSLRLPDVLEVGASAAEDASPGSLKFCGPSQGIQLPEAAGGLIKEAVWKRLRDGLRGVHSELSGLCKAYDSLSATLNTLCTTVKNQGVGSERTAQALQRLEGADRGGFPSLLPATDALSHAGAGEALAAPSCAAAAAAAPALPRKKWVDLPLAGKQKVAARNLDALSSLRDKCKETLFNNMFSSDLSAGALPDAVETKEHVHAAVRAVLNVAEDDVQDYLDSSLFFPARQVASEPVKARVVSKLGLVLPHLLQGLRRHIVPVYFKKLRVSLSEVDKAVSDQRIEDDKYTSSDTSTDAITEALKSLYRRWGAGHRVVSKSSVGQHPHVDSTVGTYALVSLLVRNHLEDIIVSVSSAEEEDSKKPPVYHQWQVEMARVRRFLPWDDKVHIGLQVVDGADPNRHAAAYTDQERKRGDGDDVGEVRSRFMPARQRDDLLEGGTMSG